MGRGQARQHNLSLQGNNVSSDHSDIFNRGNHDELSYWRYKYTAALSHSIGCQRPLKLVDSTTQEEKYHRVGHHHCLSILSFLHATQIIPQNALPIELSRVFRKGSRLRCYSLCRKVHNPASNPTSRESSELNQQLMVTRSSLPLYQGSQASLY